MSISIQTLLYRRCAFERDGIAVREACVVAAEPDWQFFLTHDKWHAVMHCLMLAFACVVIIEKQSSFQMQPMSMTSLAEDTNS